MAKGVTRWCMADWRRQRAQHSDQHLCEQERLAVRSAGSQSVIARCPAALRMFPPTPTVKRSRLIRRSAPRAVHRGSNHRLFVFRNRRSLYGGQSLRLLLGCRLRWPYLRSGFAHPSQPQDGSFGGGDSPATPSPPGSTAVYSVQSRIWVSIRSPTRTSSPNCHRGITGASWTYRGGRGAMCPAPSGQVRSRPRYLCRLADSLSTRCRFRFRKDIQVKRCRCA